MPWGAAAAAAGTIGSSLLSSKGASDAAKAAQLKSFNATTPLGSAQVNKKGYLDLQGGLGSEQGALFNEQTGRLINAYGAAPQQGLNLNPNALVGAGFGANPNADPYTAGGLGTFGQGQDVLSAFRNFNPDAFAATQFERLNRLAAPAEQTAANQTATRLFGQGRLGANDTRTGQVFRDLDLSQSLARDSRLLQSIGLAQSEQQNLFNTGTGLLTAGQNAGLTGEQLRASELSRFLQGVTGAVGVSGAQQNYANSLLSQALSTQGGLSNAYAGANTAAQYALAGAGAATNAAQYGAQLKADSFNNNATVLGQLAGSLGSAYMKYNQPSTLQQPVA